QRLRLFARATRYVTRARYSSDSAEPSQRACSAVRPNNAKNSLTLSFSDMHPSCVSEGVTTSLRGLRWPPYFWGLPPQTARLFEEQVADPQVGALRPGEGREG